MCLRSISQLFLLIFLLGCGNNLSIENVRITRYPVNSSIRAIHATSENELWFAGSDAVFGHTEDGGRNWMIDSITNDSIENLEFRSIAVTSESVMILSVGSPALLLRSTDKGKSWHLVFKDDHPGAFYDAMKFWDNLNGIAMGDPTDGCLSIIVTKDGGMTWRKIGCDSLPAAEQGEAAFAASNSNISLHGSNAWVVSGGAEARIFHSPDLGLSWEAFDTPIISGGQMTGIFSVDFYDDQTGMIIGGDWQNKNLNSDNKAITVDGGRTWRLVADGKEPGYRSCIRFMPTTSGQGIIATGSPGISFSQNKGEDWKQLSDDGFYTIWPNQTGKSAWLAGNQVIAFMSWD